MKRKLFALLVFGPVLWGCLVLPGIAQTYPDRPIRVIVPSAAGSVLDVFVRRISDTLARSLGQPIIVDNRPGANGFIGAQAAAKAKPDGYTVFYAATNILCINPALFSKLPYDPIRDFAPVVLVARGNPILLVNLKLPIRTLPEFIQYAKARPGQLTYGSPAVGSPQHVAAELLEQLAGIEMLHIPYKDQPQIMTELVGGRIDAAIEFATVAAPQVKTGRVRALAIIGPRRKPVMPEVLTAAEQGLPAFDLAAWNGFLVPTGTPPEIIARLNKAIVAAVTKPDIVDWVTGLGNEIIASTPEEFTAYIKVELARWSKLVKDAKVQVE